MIALAPPRSDFDGAIREFLIGLLTVALQPANEAAWSALWISPPGPDLLRARVDAIPASFDLEGDGVRVFQDASPGDLAAMDVVPIEQLLIEAPGGQTVKLNKDLFVKAGRIEKLGRPAAAMALITMQTYAPAGGQGHRTSMRGGGPLTSLIDPRRPAPQRASVQPLWYELWANVMTAAQWGELPGARRITPADVFPWLAPARTSEPGKPPTTPADASPLQVFFGMPRRIRLEFGAAGDCDLTGRPDDCVVTGFRMRNYGVKYEGWQHPLSPHYRTAPTADLLPVHGQPGGVAWKDWLGLTLATPDSTRVPAACVSHFIARRAPDLGLDEVRLRVFGYDMDNMKARGWTDAVRPAFAPGDSARTQVLIDLAERLTNGAGMVASAVQSTIKQAQFQRPADAPGDFSQVKTELWARTESAFFDAVRSIATTSASATDTARECAAFRDHLEDVATGIFDRCSPTAGLPPGELRRLIAARFNLVMTLRGSSKLGQKMFGALGLPRPADRVRRTSTRSHPSMEAGA